MEWSYVYDDNEDDDSYNNNFAVHPNGQEETLNF